MEPAAARRAPHAAAAAPARSPALGAWEPPEAPARWAAAGGHRRPPRVRGAPADPADPVDPDADPDADPDLRAEPEPEPDPEPGLSAEARPEFEPGPVGPVDTDLRLEPHSGPDPHPEPDTDAHRTPEPDLSVETRPQFEPGPVGPVDSDPRLELHSEPDPYPDPRPEPDPHSGPDPHPERDPHPEPDADAHLAPEPDLGVETRPEFEPGPVGPVDTDLRREPHSETDPYPPDPRPDPDPHSGPDPHSEPDADAHRAPEPDLSVETRPQFEPHSEPDPYPDPRPEPDPHPKRNPHSRPDPHPELDADAHRAPEPDLSVETRPQFEPGPVDSDLRLQLHSEPHPYPDSRPEPDPHPESDPHPELDAEVHWAPEPDPSVATEPEFEPDPVGPVDTDLRLDLHSDQDPHPEPDPHPRLEPHPEPDLHPEADADVDRAPEPDLSAEIQPEFQPGPVGPVDTEIRLELHSDPDPKPDPHFETDPHPEPDADAHRAPEPDPSAETHLEFEPDRVGPVHTDLRLDLHSDPDPHPEPGTGTGADEPLLELGPLLWPAEPETPPPAPREPEDPGSGAGEAELFPAREGPAADPEPASNPCCQAQPVPGEADDGPRLRAVFEALDADGDGFVRTEDFVQFATVYGAEQVKDLTRYLDPSGLGVISFQDFFRGITAIRNGDPEGSPALLVPEEETQTCPDEFDDFVTYEATEVTDSAYMGSESTYSECETFTDEDTSTLVQPEIHPEGDADSTGGSAVASECLDGVEELGHGALLLLPGRALLHSQVAVTVIRGEEHFEDYGEGGDGELSSESLCNGEQACSDPAFLPPSADPLTTKLHGILADEAFEFYCSQCYKQINRLEDLSARLNDLEMNSPTKRLSSKKVARHLLQSGALSMEALQAPPMEPMEDMDEDIADKVIFLEKRVSELERDTVANGEQHSRLRQENLQLVHRANALEEQLKEQELIACEKVLEEARRQRELLCRVEREKSIEVENLQARLQQLDEENSELRSCTPCLKASIQRLGEEKQKLLDEIEELSLRLSEEQENKRRLGDRLSQERHQFQRDKEATQELIEDLRKQLEHLQLFKLEAEQRRGRSNSSGLQHYNSRTRESELEQEVRRLKQDNRSLKEQNDELNGQIITLSIQGAKNLFNTSFSESLAAEISSVSRDELMEAIQKQEEINLRLQDYIDRIIVAIMETNPSILEVK